ncbi:MAG: diaminopimelate epimerase [Deltaproteobacteria bacterium]|nr:diaminopimelate epimerase [Deltaproteobacteria bacterium]
MACSQEMQGPVEIFKMSGHGNDFIIVDNSRETLKANWRDCAIRWCRRRVSVGADGLLIIGPSRDADLSLRIFNADGSEAEMCGNGVRCAARFAVEREITGSTLAISTLAGIIRARVEGRKACIRLPDLAEMMDPLSVETEVGRYLAYPVHLGVPHAVIFFDSVADLPAKTVHDLGRSVRFHRLFEPAGTNVDLLQVVAPNHIRVRTYERGVEGETMACGTGAVASAIAAHLFGDAGDLPIAVEMPGGVLDVSFMKDGFCFSNIWLSGDVDWVFHGEILKDGEY